MAFPVIKIDSTDGAASDSACSGAGPATAVTGTCHNNNGVDAYLTVSGSLTGVATDGSHAIYVETPSGRRFARITGISGSQVTTANAFPAIDSGSPVNYAIGGVRATLAGTNSRLLMEQASSLAGDASAGWTIEMQSGHTETIASTVNVRVDNSDSDGWLTIRGNPNSATMPVLTFSNDGVAFDVQVGAPQFESLDLRNSAGTKTASIAINFVAAISDGQNARLINLVIANSSNNFYTAVSEGSTAGRIIAIGCEFGHCANRGVDFTGNNAVCSLIGCYIHDCTSHGVYLNMGNYYQSMVWYRTVLANNGGNGAYLTGASNSFSFSFGLSALHCVFDNNTLNGVDFNTQRGSMNCGFINCQFTNNTQYGLDFPSASTTFGNVGRAGHYIVGCNFYGNTSGATSISGLETSFVANDCTTLDPQYVNAASGDYRIGNATLLTGGYPSGNIAGTITPAFPTIGADQAAGGASFSPTFRRKSSPQLRM